MLTVFESDRVVDSRSHDKPQLESYDSGAEFSLSNWIHVRNLVNRRDIPVDNETLASVSATMEVAKYVSEVETATAYQNFSSNVVR